MSTKSFDSSKKVSEVIQSLEEWVPSSTAERWDNVGLLVGDPDWETQGAVVSVDLSLESLQKAESEGYRLIVNHHPCIFPTASGGLSAVTPGPTAEDLKTLIFQAIQKKIAIIACHTNFDQCALEVVQRLSEDLGIKPKGRILGKETRLTKLVVFVPQTHLEQVRTAICEAGAGKVGDYDFTTFGVEGDVTFRGSEGSNPFLGTPGELTRGREVRLETIFPERLQKRVLKALFQSHPYEEVAYDLYSVSQPPSSVGLTRGLGYGFWGDFESGKSFPDVVQSVKKCFGVQGYWPALSKPERIQRVAFTPGKGASFVSAVSQLGCDLYITGEVGYHASLEGARRGVTVLEIGHPESEIYFLKVTSDWLQKLGLRVMQINHWRK